MKNFPHQINKIELLTQGLRVFGELKRENKDVLDDGVVGDALARKGIYQFRSAGQEVDIEARLGREHQKPPGSQGTRTCARELRRFFRLLGFLTTNEELSHSAMRLCKMKDPSSRRAKDLWSQALLDMELGDKSGMSHPYRIMLRLVGAKPGVKRAFLGLCLCPADDGEEEFGNILHHAERFDEPAEMWKLLGVTSSSAANSVKILPSLAEQIGDIHKVDGAMFLSRQAIGREPAIATKGAGKDLRRRYDSSNPRGQRIESSIRKSIRIFDPDSMSERYSDHEKCLRNFSHLFDVRYQQWEGNYDLLVASDNDLLLAEVKTVRDDAAKQVRLGLGQILYYKHMLVEPNAKGKSIYQVLVLDREIQGELIDFLTSHNVGVIWIPDKSFVRCSKLARRNLGVFGVAIP